MNRDRLEGSWKLIKGLVLEKWGQLTSDDETVGEGREEQLVGALQLRYAAQRGDARGTGVQALRRAAFYPTATRLAPGG